MKIFLAIAVGGTGCPEPFRRIKENADIFSGGGSRDTGFTRLRHAKKMVK